MHVKPSKRAFDALPGVALQLGVMATSRRCMGATMTPFCAPKICGRSLREILSGLRSSIALSSSKRRCAAPMEHQRRESFEFELAVDGETRSYEARVAPGLGSAGYRAPALGCHAQRTQRSRR